MKILGIETSCDETAVCLIEAEGDFSMDFKYEVLGNALISQAAIHAEYGGVFPNLAKREHAKNLVPLLERALNEAGTLGESPASYQLQATSLDALLSREPELLEQLKMFLVVHQKPNVDAIAVTYGPGLEPALWVGVNFAKALSLVWDVPIVAVNHMEGHIVLSMMEENRLARFEFPVLALLISGGHTELVFSQEFGTYKLVGKTRDDAVGEAFDKVARLLGLPYPGGPEISRLAAAARNYGSATSIKFPRPMIDSDNYDFSFSGLKTAVRRLVGEFKTRRVLNDETRGEIALEFEDAVADVLVAKTLRAVEEFRANTIVVGGGVSANTHIRAQLANSIKDYGFDTKLLIPPPEFATDNAIMIALAGYFHALEKDYADPVMLGASGNLKLC